MGHFNIYVLTLENELVTHLEKLFLTCGLRAAMLCCAPSSAAGWCSPEAAGGGSDVVTFPDAEEGWYEMAHLKQPLPVWVWLCCSLYQLHQDSSPLLTLLHTRQTLGLQTTVRLGETQMPRN